MLVRAQVAGPRTGYWSAHEMLVRTPGQLALQQLISSPAGSTGAAGCCVAPEGHGWLPLSRGPGGTHGPEAAAAAPLVAAGTAQVPAASPPPPPRPPWLPHGCWAQIAGRENLIELREDPRLKATYNLLRLIDRGIYH
ncbi:hypothetical protein P7K49_031847 [Saguinus oedipus]|uniref:Uncharacterized protein n=1 Tax=Saguinus oedipus TaxID=9490 RepID=A0ABQ9U0J3_SAGOE|nr:hypothetical protein P7K49_031847 [Saguinus oedipus]